MKRYIILFFLISISLLSSGQTMNELFKSMPSEYLPAFSEANKTMLLVDSSLSVIPYALVHFNMEELEQKLKEMTSDASIKIEDKVTELKADLLEYINSKVSNSSKLQDIIDYVEPFKKTATNKIKRYLYKSEDVKK